MHIDNYFPDEEEIFIAIGAFNNPDFRKQVEEHKPYIEQFIKKYDCDLLEINATTENSLVDKNGLPVFEPTYTFNDGMFAYYTIEGIKKSLEDD